jgi:hypothetical protein
MTTRTSRKTVTFTRPFFLSGIDEVRPAGTYAVETDEELLQALSFPAYRRVATWIRLQGVIARPHGRRPPVAGSVGPNDRGPLPPFAFGSVAAWDDRGSEPLTDAGRWRCRDSTEGPLAAPSTWAR